MEIGQDELMALVGHLYVQNTVLQRRLAAVAAHTCDPCPNECCNVSEPLAETAHGLSD